MLTNCLAECAHLTITVSQIKEILVESRHFLIDPLHSTPPLRGCPTFRRNIATPFGMEKLEWLGYPTVEKFRRYLYSFSRNSRTWRTDTASRYIGYRAYAYASRGKNCLMSYLQRCLLNLYGFNFDLLVLSLLCPCSGVTPYIFNRFNRYVEFLKLLHVEYLLLLLCIYSVSM